MTSHEQKRYGRARLMFMYFAPPVAWGLQLLIGYGLVALACSTGTKIAFFTLSGLAGALTLAAGVTSFASWHERGIAELGTTPNSDEFVAAAGVILAIVFLVLIVATGLYGAALNPCAPLSMALP
ncbi:MAG: hypothetical protein GC204_06205 [Chloroflexi bacterium]|nr:hypothetical protein [Chloroflexota bacterium]